MSEGVANGQNALSEQPVVTKSHGRRLMEEPKGWLDTATMYVADRCSPILVKETRQALKSRQFQWTFLMLLLAVVIWSFLGISIALRSGAEENGTTMLSGYLVILGFPLAVVIPTAAFRSLAREYEDETIQLVSITSMSARRIVLGKLGSAAMQIALYMAAVTPCIVFSYVLRGLSFSIIWMGASLAGTGSLMLTCLALAVAGACRSVLLRVAANLFLLLVLLGAFGLWCTVIADVNLFTRQEDAFLMGSNFMVLLFLTVGYVLVESTSSLISFAAENRSTRVRVALLVLVAVFICGMVGTIFQVSPTGVPIEPILLMISSVGSFFFTAVGCLTASERSGLSNRVRRDLPVTILGRFARGILLPGPGRGFLFAISAIVSVNLLPFMLGWLNFEGFLPYIEFGSPVFQNRFWVGATIVNMLFGCGYVSTIYLLMLLLERYAGSIKTLVGLMLGVILFVLVAILSMTLHEFLFDYNLSEVISPAYYLNWPVMLYYCTDYSGAPLHLYGFVLLVGLPISLITLIAYFVSLRELVVTAASIPNRIKEDDKPKTSVKAKSETFEEVFQQRHSNSAAQ